MVIKPRSSSEIARPSGFHCGIAFDDWHGTRSNSQGGFVLGARLVVMKRGLVEIENEGIVSEYGQDEQAQTEQDDPKDFQALFDNWSGDCVLSVRNPYGQAMFLLPSPAPMRINDGNGHRSAVQQACVGVVVKELSRFEFYDLAGEAREMFFSATAVFCNNLFPIDGVTEARPPFVKGSSNGMSCVMPSAAMSYFPLMFRLWRSTPEQARDHSFRGWMVSLCGQHVGSRLAPRVVPTPNCFATNLFLLVSLPGDMVSDECLHGAIGQLPIHTDCVPLAIGVKAAGHQLLG